MLGAKAKKLPYSLPDARMHLSLLENFRYISTAEQYHSYCLLYWGNEVEASHHTWILLQEKRTVECQVMTYGPLRSPVALTR